MPQFETFTKQLISRQHEPQVTIQRRGALSLNKPACLALGSPDAVELLYDAHARIIGLRRVEPGTEHAYAVRPATSAANGRCTISAMAFTKFYNIDTSQSLRWSAYLDAGVLCVDLNDKPTPVTSNRARASGAT